MLLAARGSLGLKGLSYYRSVNSEASTIHRPEPGILACGAAQTIVENSVCCSFHRRFCVLTPAARL